jgi:hypothetical protein
VAAGEAVLSKAKALLAVKTILHKFINGSATTYKSSEEKAADA